MGQLKINQQKAGQVLKLEFAGQVDEDATLGSVSLAGASQVDIDLGKITAINSCGIREWIKWIKTAGPDAKVVYRNCPKVIVDQINMVAGFLPTNGTVESFFVPYYCDGNGNEKMVLFSKGKEFGPGGVKPPNPVKDEESGEEMEMDVIEAKYFKFVASMR